MVRILFIPGRLQPLPEHALFLVIPGQLRHAFRILAVCQIGRQFFKYEIILLPLGRLASVDRLFHSQVAVEADQGRTLIGIQVAFQGRPYLVANKTAAVVAAFRCINICLGGDNMAKLRSNRRRNIDFSRIGIIPQKGYSVAVLNCSVQGNSVDLNLGRIVCPGSKIADNRSGDIAVVLISDQVAICIVSGSILEIDQVALFIPYFDVDRHNRFFRIIDQGIGPCLYGIFIVV